MSTSRACSVLFFAVLLAIPTFGQSVISTHSGVVYYFDGSVYVGDQPLQGHLGKFSTLPLGAELRTEQGHAEVLLTPGVFLRIGQNSAVRMLGNDLANTRVELERGSAIMDSGEPNSGTSVTLVFRDWQIHSAQAGSYRIDSDPPRMWALQGNAEVVTGTEKPVQVEQGMDMPLAAVLVPEQSNAQPTDDLTNWAKGRSDSIVADNAITQQIGNDPDSQSAGLGGLGGGGFSYFPLIGGPTVNASYASPYSSTVANQPGFSSMYLPGYTSLPFMLMYVGRYRGIRNPLLPIRSGPVFLPRVGMPAVIGRPPVFVPHSTPVTPIAPMAPHSTPMPHPMPHPVIHR